MLSINCKSEEKNRLKFNSITWAQQTKQRWNNHQNNNDKVFRQNKVHKFLTLKFIHSYNITSKCTDWVKYTRVPDTVDCLFLEYFVTKWKKVNKIFKPNKMHNCWWEKFTCELHIVIAIELNERISQIIVDKVREYKKNSKNYNEKSFNLCNLVNVLKRNPFHQNDNFSIWWTNLELGETRIVWSLVLVSQRIKSKIPLWCWGTWVRQRSRWA